MSDWIVINKRWDATDTDGAWDTAPQIPDLDERIGEVFGKTTQQSWDEYTQKYGDFVSGEQPRQSQKAKAALKEHCSLVKKIDKWLAKQPEMIAFQKSYSEYADALASRSFSNEAKAGMQIELTNGKQLIIGDVALNGENGCDCCSDKLMSGTTVYRYRMLE